MMPFQILGMWLRPLFLLAVLGLGVYLVADWFNRLLIFSQPGDAVTVRVEPESENGSADEQRGASSTVRRPASTMIRNPRQLGFNAANAWMVAGVAMIFWSLGGGWISTLPFLFREPNLPKELVGGVVQRLRRPDGTELHVEVFGSSDGIPVVLTHGWGLDSREWIYAIKELEKRCRIIVWDLPGLGRSKGPDNKDWSLEKLATDLDAVITFAGPRPVFLVGHSIGGMIILTYCRLIHSSLSTRVAGLVFGQTTYTNPIETTSMASFYRIIQKPVLEPLCYLMVGLSPLVRVMNWWSYANGSVHRTNHKSFFSGKETREQLGFISRYTVQSSPAVLARGFLAMFHFDAKPTLRTINVPTLVVGGDRDITCKLEASMTMSQSISAARLTTLKEARHGGVFEFHQQFAEAIHQFISTSLPTNPIDDSEELRQAKSNAALT